MNAPDISGENFDRHAAMPGGGVITITCNASCESRIAAYFMKRQIITMPAYDKRLSEAEIKKLIAYIHWLRKPVANP